MHIPAVRKAGGVAIYVRQSLNATEWPIFKLDPKYEMLWIKVVQNSDVTFICVLYHPPSSIYDTSDLLDIIGNIVLRIHQEHPDSHIILAGNLNTLPDSELVIRTGMTSIVNQPTSDKRKQLP